MVVQKRASFWFTKLQGAVLGADFPRLPQTDLRVDGYPYMSIRQDFHKGSFLDKSRVILECRIWPTLSKSVGTHQQAMINKYHLLRRFFAAASAFDFFHVMRG